MGLQKNLGEPLEKPVRTVSITIEGGVLVARRVENCDHSSESFDKLKTAWVSGLNEDMSKVVVGSALLDFILDWVNTEPVTELNDTFNVETEDGLQDDMSEV